MQARFAVSHLNGATVPLRGAFVPSFFAGELVFWLVAGGCAWPGCIAPGCDSAAINASTAGNATNQLIAAAMMILHISIFVVPLETIVGGVTSRLPYQSAFLSQVPPVPFELGLNVPALHTFILPISPQSRLPAHEHVFLFTGQSKAVGTLA